MSKEKPILFSTEMVKAILDGRKSQTRRIIKSKHESGMFQVSTAKYEPNRLGYYHNRSVHSIDWDERTVDGGDILCPYGEVGDILWVRETWADWGDIGRGHRGYAYKADGFIQRYGAWERDVNNKFHDVERIERWKPSIYMPRAAARIFLQITDIKVERLQDISEEDAKAEGVLYYGEESNDYKNYLYNDKYGDDWGVVTAKDSFRTLWQSIHGPDSWEANPWLWCITFKRIIKP